MIFIEQYEGLVRLGVFAGVFIFLAGLEILLPRKERITGRRDRWITNLSIVVLDTIVLRLTFPFLALAMAEIAARNGWGLLSRTNLPLWFETVLAFLLLDLLIYVQHVASHKVPVFWAIHRVHHSDRDIDLTTALRFHPIEISLSMGYKFLCILLLGPPILGVFIFEILLNASAMFNHANFRLPDRLDQICRQVIVTPDMHRVHHSVIHSETDSNYGFCLSVWDRLFGTYVPQPREGHADMTIGLSEYQSEKPSRLLWALWLPFTRLSPRGKPARPR